MYGRTFTFVENFHVNLSVVLEFFHVFHFRGTRVYLRKLFNLEHFPIYGINTFEVCLYHLNEIISFYYYFACVSLWCLSHQSSMQHAHVLKLIELIY